MPKLDNSATLDALPIHEEGWSYDNELIELGTIAAWIGHEGGNPTPVTFDSLLAAFLLGSDGESKWFQKQYSQVDQIIRDKWWKQLGVSISDDKILERSACGEVPKESAQDKNYYSQSVRLVLTEACNYQRLIAPEQRLTPRLVLAAYLFDGKGVHEEAFSEFPLNDWRARFVLPEPNDVGASVDQVVHNVLLYAKQIRAANPNARRDLSTQAIFHSVIIHGRLRNVLETSASHALATLLAPLEQSMFREHQSIMRAPLPEVEPGIEQMSGNSGRLLLFAGEYSRVYFNSPRRIEENGLVAALMQGVSETVLDVLRRGKVSLDDLRLDFARTIGEHDRAAGYTWQRLFKVIGAPDQTRLISNFRADDPLDERAEDQLDVDDEARAFARIVAATDVTPPLAIGIFGEWGSGKSFFMQLLHRHVKSLCKDASQGVNDDLFHCDIVQIRFNAWHYMETNLWASLVDYIFCELDLWLCHKKRKAHSEVETLFGKLNTVRELQLESARDLIDAVRAQRRARTQLAVANQEYEHALKEQHGVTGNILSAAVETALKGYEDEIRKAAKNAGLLELANDAGDLKQQVEEFYAAGNTTGGLVRSLTAVMGRWQTLLVMLVLFVVVPLVLLGVANVGSIQKDVADWLKSFVNGSGYYLAMISGVLSWIITVATSSQTKLKSFQDRLENNIEKKTRDQRDQLAKAAEKLSDCGQDVKKAAQDVRDTSQQVNQAKAEWRFATPRSRLNRFIRAKVVDGDYAKHLGIIASVRRDFAQLAEIMADEKASTEDAVERANKDQAYTLTVQHLIKEAGSDLSSEAKEKLLSSTHRAEDDDELKSFQRIILYIDDLDRCPPDKVVDILQAIHLLLCFPLFVVVVAVDARWVSRAIHREFPDLLSEDVTISNGHPEEDSSVHRSNSEQETFDRPGGASSQDYLEKIFQIPYWVRRMEDRSAQKYVRWLAQISKEVDPSKGKLDVALTRKVDDQSGFDRRLEGPVVQEAVEPVPVTQPQESVQAISRKQDETSDEERQEVMIKGLRISDYEQVFLSYLAPFTGGSPRRALRFVNSYRLAKTSLKPYQLDELLGDNGELLAYRALITQLAITTGAPHVAHCYFQLLQQAPDSIEDLIAKLEVDKRITRLRGEWCNVKGALEALKARNIQDEIDCGSEMIEALQQYALIASRYSFTARPH